MRSPLFRHITSLCLAVLLIFKGVVFMLAICTSHLENINISELLIETEQEGKKGNKTEPGADEFFDKALLPSEVMLPKNNSSIQSAAFSETLQDVYLDTLTPPPNS